MAGNVNITISGDNVIVDVLTKTGIHDRQKKSIPITEVLITADRVNNKLKINADGVNFVFDNENVSVPTGADAEAKMDSLNTSIKANSLADGLSISKGEVPGTTYVHKFGAAIDFDTGDNEVNVWDGTDDADAYMAPAYTYSTTAAIDSISSDDNGDTQDIEIQGLDASYNLVVQTVTLTGQTREALTTDLIRVFRVKNVSSTDFAGHIFVFENVATTNGVPNTISLIRAIVHPANNQTEMAMYTVPNGKKAYLECIYSSTAGGSRATNFIIRLKAKPFGQVFQLKYRTAINSDSPSEKRYDVPQLFSAKTDIEMTAEITEAAITGGGVIAGFDIILVDD